MKSTAVVDSTCLIALERIARFSLLNDLYSPVTVPPEVASEFGRALDWLEIRRPANMELFHKLHARLGAGESAAIALAMETAPSVIILDDLDARHHARKLGLPVIGTVGLTLKAKRAGVVPEVRIVLDELIQSGFYLSMEIRNDALRIANELG